MKPLFTLGAFLEKTLKRANVWVPLKDTGVDLLVSDEMNRRAVSLQVKFSKDFLVTHMKPGFQQQLRACGWWSLNRDKLVKSRADYWVFVLQGFASRSTDFVVIPREQLLETLSAVHGGRKTMQSYISRQPRRMKTNHLTASQRAGGEMILGRGRGWGYGMSVVTEALKARTKYAKGGHEYWLEGTFQIGSFGAGTIRAWKHVQVTSRRHVLDTWGSWLRWSTFLLNLATRRMAGMDPRSVGY